MANVDIRNELLINYLCHHREAVSIGDALAFIPKGWYRSIVHIGAIRIWLAVDSVWRKHQLAVSHAVFLSVNGIDHIGRSAVRLVHWYRRSGAGVSQEAGWLRTIHRTNKRGKGVWKDEFGELRIQKDEIRWLRVWKDEIGWLRVWKAEIGRILVWKAEIGRLLIWKDEIGWLRVWNKVIGWLGVRNGEIWQLMVQNYDGLGSKTIHLERWESKKMWLDDWGYDTVKLDGWSSKRTKSDNWGSKMVKLNVWASEIMKFWKIEGPKRLPSD